MKKNNLYKILGLLIVLLNIIPVYNSLYLLYSYNYTSILFHFIYSTYLLCTVIVLGFIGISCGILVVKKSNKKPLIYLIIGFIMVIINATILLT